MSSCEDSWSDILAVLDAPDVKDSSLVCTNSGSPSVQLKSMSRSWLKTSSKKRVEENKRKGGKMDMGACRHAFLISKGLQSLVSYHLGEETFSKWLECRLPTYREGKEVTKSQVKKLTKLMEAYKKKYEKSKAQEQQ
ncbi:unnamed protein product [Meganyctiphanes norvegica]|uniref:Uncharacterized protein n=1 Tax=Meganyctiphanes norvegica TaxID=48144 RepID=A0AAV2RXL8_MEGNR